MRKLFSVVLALMLLLAVTRPLQIYASDELTFSVDSIGTVARGKTVTIPIIVSNNTGFVTTGLVVAYDPNVLEIADVTAPLAEMPLNNQFSLTSTPGTQWIHLINTKLVDWRGNGIVVNMTFHVKSTAAIGASNIILSFTSSPNGSPANADGTILSDARTVSTSVNVVDKINSVDSWVVIGATNNIVTPTPTPRPTSTPWPISTPWPTPITNTSTMTPDTSKPTTLPDVPVTLENTDNGEFIGTFYPPNEPVLATETKEAESSSFGKVPQTGVPSITYAVVSMCASFTVTAILLGYLLHRKYAESDHGQA